MSWPAAEDVDLFVDENGESLRPKLADDPYADRSEFEPRIPAMAFAREPQAQIEASTFMGVRVWPRVFR
jgi:hypothetical protein